MRDRRTETPHGSPFGPTDLFVDRHVGPRPHEMATMLEAVGFDTLEALADAVVPGDIALGRRLELGPPRAESEVLERLRGIAAKNRTLRSLIGLGYHGCVTPPVIQRNILENPGWYTQYTPYQAEIAQGRLEALLNFQTMVADLTGLPLANASLLDEATAAAEAMAMCFGATRGKRSAFFASERCHPQTLAVLATRAEPLGIELVVGDAATAELGDDRFCGVLVQYPDTHGRLDDLAPLAARAHEAGALLVAAADLLALALVVSPGSAGADIAVGSTQRFGVPMGFGGPHAAYLATSEAHKRQIPGRIVGVSKDVAGRPALRLALQTREQHIRRDKATSNICTAQVLLAVMAGMYAVYHGPEGLRRIARRVHGLTRTLAAGLRRLGLDVGDAPYFDTLRVAVPAGRAERVHARALELGINLRRCDGEDAVGVALDETCDLGVVGDLLDAFAAASDGGALELEVAELAAGVGDEPPAALARQDDYLTHEVFRRYRSEHEMLRYMARLEARDLSLVHSMIPLGSCTMKLNGTSQMVPVSWPELAALHPFAPVDQAAGYRELFDDLERWLAEITGFAAVSLQPNAGAQGEYAGLLVIRAWHRSRGDAARDVCLIPVSAHGTNPASAVMAGMRVVPVACDEHGNIDVDDLRARAAEHAERLAALMVTYPSTHGVFEASIREVCEIVHAAGGQVYLDGANMNAQVGLCRPGDYGADVVHLNLHKTFCIPHGGGGPGMGPIGVAAHLAPFLPGHPLGATGGESAIGPVAAAPWGSPSILPIPWVYIAAMGAEGLTEASRVAVLSANYLAARLREQFPILYTGPGGLVAHEFIVDLRPFKASAGVTVDDVAKRLMDFGIHAPTMSWPVAGTLMVEPTESESLEELDRFCDAMITIREEIREIEQGRVELERSPLRHAPHTAADLADESWDRPYSRRRGVFPAPWVEQRKFWPAVGRIDNAWGDRHLVCTCGSVEEMADRG